MNPTQVDYEDYREVNGVKVPFKWTVTWTDGRSVIELSSLQPNVPVDAEKFSKPAPPAKPNRAADR
jgi:outer membrane lipoprotein-sorting protein